MPYITLWWRVIGFSLIRLTDTSKAQGVGACLPMLVVEGFLILIWQAQPASWQGEQHGSDLPSPDDLSTVAEAPGRLLASHPGHPHSRPRWARLQAKHSLS